MALRDVPRNARWYSRPVRSLCSSLVLLALSFTACSDSTGSTDDQDTGSQTTAPTGGAEDTAGNFDCATYCERITMNCTAGNAQYTNLQLCEATCATFDGGAQSDTTGNTLGCRIYHAGAAAGDPATHCTHAGPGGNGMCGANCQGFCTTAVRTCPAEWPEQAACETTCAGFSDAESYDASDAAGDTLACRLYHLTVSTVFPDEHCPHTAAMSSTCL